MDLEGIAFHVAQGAHTVLLLDQAGWHGSAKWSFPTTLRCCRCRPDAPNSTLSRTYGISSATPGFPTGSFQLTMASSIIAASPETNWSISAGGSCPSGSAIERKGTDQCTLVLIRKHVRNAPSHRLCLAQLSRLLASMRKGSQLPQRAACKNLARRKQYQFDSGSFYSLKLCLIEFPNNLRVRP